MPKEITYSTADDAFVRTPDGNEYRAGSDESKEAEKVEGAKYFQRGVHVGWMKERQVELGVASFDISREMPSDGVFVTLDRYAINRLIRSLRKARDAAYGSDA